jgi:hypothetical protein
MKNLLAASALAMIAAGCATAGDQVAAAECKIAPITLASSVGKARPVSPLEQRYAEMQLASTDYRMRLLARNGLVNNNVEDALRDCDRATP